MLDYVTRRSEKLGTYIKKIGSETNWQDLSFGTHSCINKKNCPKQLQHRKITVRTDIISPGQFFLIDDLKNSVGVRNPTNKKVRPKNGNLGLDVGGSFLKWLLDRTL